METLHAMESILPMTCLVLGIAAVIALVAIPLLKLLDLRRLLKQKWVFLELTPPAEISRSPEATQQLFVNLYGLNRSRPFINKILFQKVVFTAEIASNRPNGMRFMLRAPRQKVNDFTQAIASYNQAIKVKQVDDYIPKDLNRLNTPSGNPLVLLV